MTTEPEESRKTPGTHAHRYPRHLTEAGGPVGSPRVIGLAVVGTIGESMRALEEVALEDLGGEENVSALRREVLRLGVAAEEIGALLLAEIQDKARHSRRTGHVPHVSRYGATGVAGYWLGLAARLYERVGLARRPKHVNLEAYLREKAAREGNGGAESSDPSGSEPSPSVPGEVSTAGQDVAGAGQSGGGGEA